MSNINYKISFLEMQQLSLEKISKQAPSTLEEKRKQFKELKKLVILKNNKRSN